MDIIYKLFNVGTRCMYLFTLINFIMAIFFDASWLRTGIYFGITVVSWFIKEFLYKEYYFMGLDPNGMRTRLFGRFRYDMIIGVSRVGVINGSWNAIIAFFKYATTSNNKLADIYYERNLENKMIWDCFEYILYESENYHAENTWDKFRFAISKLDDTHENALKWGIWGIVIGTLLSVGYILLFF